MLFVEIAYAAFVCYETKQEDLFFNNIFASGFPLFGRQAVWLGGIQGFEPTKRTLWVTAKEAYG